MHRSHTEHEPIFGRWLQRRRKALGLTQVQLAENVRCSPATIRKLESDERRPSKPIARRLAECLGVDDSELRPFVEFARGGWSDRPIAGPALEPPSPWRTANHDAKHLPGQLTRLVGRDAELATVTDRLRRGDVRLLTLTGPGGIGKTRLALESARELALHFEHGASAVMLAAIDDPATVIATIAQTLGVAAGKNRPVAQEVMEHLREQETLLLLDNFEQVVDAAPQLVDILSACPGLKLLITSREVLHLRGEQELRLEPLPVPNAVASDESHPSNVAAFPAVELFVERAGDASAGFALDSSNADAVAEICTRLDGVPLAIELAAARIRLFPPRLLLDRLASGLDILAGGARDAPARQRTLRAAIAWSYDLLNEEDQAVFRRLSVFRGGFSLEAAEAVCRPDDDVFERIASLVDKSLLTRMPTDDELRFTMLGTLQEYAGERLTASGEEDTVRQRHAQYYLDLAKQAEPELVGDTQAAWLEKLTSEIDNLRAVGELYRRRGDTESITQLELALVAFWAVRIPTADLRARLEPLLPSAPHSGKQRARLLYQLGIVAVSQGDHSAAEARFHEAFELFERLGNRPKAAMSLLYLAVASQHRGESATTRASVQRALDFGRESGDDYIVAASLTVLGELARSAGDYLQAEKHYVDAEAVGATSWSQSNKAGARLNRAYVALNLGDATRAAALFLESLELSHQLQDAEWTSGALAGLACVAAATGDGETAAVLFAASESLDTVMGFKPQPVDRAEIERYRPKAHADMDAPSWEAAWSRGQAMRIEQAVEFARDRTSQG